jgi:sulfatase maturation enzyme AslB (radical SAM superfamily)
MKLEDIGFYTLSDRRAKTVSWESDLQRCELILTDRCNFNCIYCRGIKQELRGDLTITQAKEIIDIWASGNLCNVRFSGGEPTVWLSLLELVKYTRSFSCFEHIAISTNGSASLDYYKELMTAGVNDFSISLDACCSKTQDMMAGVNSHFDHICMIIKELSKVTYVTVGVVLEKQNKDDLKGIIDYANTLGVSDIRIIPSSQSNHFLQVDVETELPILKYRVQHLKEGRHVRGIQPHDCSRCHLVKDDMVVLHGKHFPCVIYMREQGLEIGSVYGKTLEQIRSDRKEWFENTDTKNDLICKNNCLDVCIDHNNKVEEYITIAST